jgi:3-carboxy-cis,cis-muconate cycloisomerase
MTSIDGRLTDLIVGTAAMNAVWSPAATVQAMLDVEAALARACAAHGVIPSAAVGHIEAACDTGLLDLTALMHDAALGGNLAIPLVKQLTAVVKAGDVEAARYVHWGATSQDIIDTGMMLQLRAAYAQLDEGLQQACDALATQAERHRDTPVVARTWLQQALPTTQGYKFAQWLDALMRLQSQLQALRQDGLALQFGGAAGTLASLREAAPAVTSSLASDLGLPQALVPWHTLRDRIASAASFFGTLIGVLGKMARDISLQMQTELGELAEPAAAGKGGSSTMPHKRNPVGCAAVLSAAVRAPGLVSTVFAGMVQEHERALGGWQAEWEAVPELARLAGGSLAQIGQIVAGIEVDTTRMAEHLGTTRGFILGEAVMLALGDKIGRLDAHHLVDQAVKTAVASGRTLHDVLAADATVATHLDAGQLVALLDPANYSGQAAAFVDAVLAKRKHHG